MISIPQSLKSRTLRVASLAPRERVIAAIWAWIWLMGCPPFAARGHEVRVGERRFGVERQDAAGHVLIDQRN